jgi:diguanylate cyclase (GGDEF)-like protein
MAGSSTPRGLPSVTVFFVVAGLLMMVPMALLGRSSADNATERLRNARAIEDRVESVDAWLRLGVVLGAEHSVNAAVLSSRGLPVQLREALNLTLDESLATTRADVDAQAARVGDADIRAEIEAVRAELDEGGGDAGAVSTAMAATAARVRRGGDIEVTGLTATLAEVAGGAEIIRSVEVARAAAHLSASTSEVIGLWGSVAGPNDVVAVDQVRRFSDALALRREAADRIDAVVEPGSAVDAAWREVVDDPIYASTEQVFENTLMTLLDPAADADAGPGSDEPADRLFEFFDDVAAIREVIDDVIEINDRTFAVFEASMDEVATINGQLLASAESARTTAYVFTALFIALCLVVVIAMIRLIERPIVRLGEVVRAASAGDLRQRADVTGPRELRTTARALNDALDSLERVEQQASALAEERLDDPVLDESAPGLLGKSLQAAVGRLADNMSERDQFQRQLAHEASHDALTLVRNRGSILRQLDAAIDRSANAGTSLAILFLDLDEFKGVNDRFGHHAGDRLLQHCARRIDAAICSGDQVGRVGGDEFIVIAETVTDVDEALVLAERIRSEVMTPVDFGDVCLTPSVSIGVTMSGSDRLASEDVVREADLAVYQAKARGRGRVEVCDSALRAQVLERGRLDLALRTGLAENEFVLQYQPIIDAATGEVTMIEALVRWQRPGHGLVPPDAFIPHAERSDLVIDLDRWVLDAAARQLHEWTNHPQLGSMPVTVNISSRHISSGRLAADVLSCLERWDVTPDRLIVEITETALLDDLPVALQALDTVRSVGVRIALDDFGTGYLSLGVLRDIQADTLKIDRSFIARLDQPTERSLVALMIDTGHLLGVTIIAEGVETPDQRDTLIEMGSDHLQGFLYGMPSDAATLEVLCSRSRLTAVI